MDYGQLGGDAGQVRPGLGLRLGQRLGLVLEIGLCQEKATRNACQQPRDALRKLNLDMTRSRLEPW